MKKTKLKVISLCSGIGCQERGIQNTSCFEPKVVATSEINRDAVLSYAAIHCGLTEEMVTLYPDYPSLDQMRKELTDLNLGYEPEKDKKYDWYRKGKKFEDGIRRYWLACKLSNNLGDVSRIGKLPKADVWFMSFPCTDISIAGKLKGINPNDGTRSSLIWQTLRLLEESRKADELPEYMMLENVKNLVGKRFIGDFEKFNELIGEFGYNVYWRVLNAKNCGVPQNRERVFAVYIRKDIDTGRFTFPKPFDNGLRLKDILEDKVDEKYYVETEKAHELIRKLIDDGTLEIEEKTGIDMSVKDPRTIDVANCVSARQDRGISNRQAEGSGVLEHVIGGGGQTGRIQHKAL